MTSDERNPKSEGRNPNEILILAEHVSKETLFTVASVAFRRIVFGWPGRVWVGASEGGDSVLRGVGAAAPLRAGYPTLGSKPVTLDTTA